MTFITSLWKSEMESQADRDAKMRLRVAEASINAQRIVDSFQEPETSVFSKSNDARTTDRPMYGASHADVKNSEAGTRSTFLAAKYYAEEGKKRRDELLAKYAGSS